MIYSVICSAISTCAIVWYTFDYVGIINDISAPNDDILFFVFLIFVVLQGIFEDRKNVKQSRVFDGIYGSCFYFVIIMGMVISFIIMENLAIFETNPRIHFRKNMYFCSGLSVYKIVDTLFHAAYILKFKIVNLKSNIHYSANTKNTKIVDKNKKH